MAPIWRWVLAMSGSAFVLLAGLIVIWLGGPDYGIFGWFIFAIGVASLTINIAMRRQFLQGPGGR